MTLHISYDHQCRVCGADYIPYDEGVPCPRCGTVEQERLGFFISLAASSAGYNSRMYGSYGPAAWYIGSLADRILLLVFGVLEEHRMDPNGRAFTDVAKEMLEKMDWRAQPYLRDHVHAIAVRVYEQLNTGYRRLAINKGGSPT